MKHGLLLLLLIACAWACQPADDQQDSDDFAAFYEKFHQDSLYQINHISFPLEGLPPNALREDPSFRWHADDWQMHRPFNSRNAGFNTEQVRLGEDLVVEKIISSNGKFGMMRRFARLNGEWYLIYYAGMNAISKN